MPNPNPNKSTRIKKGQVLNPRGGAAHNPEIKALRRMSNIQLAEVGTLLLEGNLERLREIKKKEIGSAIQIWIATLVVHAIEHNKIDVLDCLLDRIVGKPKEDNHLTVTAMSGVPSMTEEEAAKLLTQAKEKC